MTLFDPGLQPERTELAWRRTALAVAVGSLVALRLVPAALDDPWWVLCGVAGLVIAGMLWVGIRRRFRVLQAVLATEGDRGVLPGAALLAGVAALVLVAGIGGVALVLVVAFA